MVPNGFLGNMQGLPKLEMKSRNDRGRDRERKREKGSHKLETGKATTWTPGANLSRLGPGVVPIPNLTGHILFTQLSLVVV
jgi:hypothetical protein